MSESKYQSKIIKKLEKKGWYCIKIIQTNKNGTPDLLCLKPNKRPFFIEFKAKKGKVAPLQSFRMNEILIKGGVKSVIMREPL